MSKVLPKRSELPKEQTWNVEALFASEQEWTQALEAARASVTQFKPFVGRLAESGQVLLQALETHEDLQIKIYKVFLYASLHASTDGGDAAYTSMVAQARGTLSQLGAAAAFIEPELLGIDPEILEALIQSEPGLATYRHYFDTLQLRKPHILNADLEAMLAAASDPLSGHSATSSAATNADMTFRPVEFAGGQLPVSHSSVGELLVHPDAAVRKAAWESYADGHLAFKNTLASSLQGGIKSYIFNIKSRGYPSSLEAALAVARTANNIPKAVYDNLISTFKANLPTWHKFWRIRKQAKGSLHTYDVPIYDSPAPLVESPKISFEEASNLICRGMEPLGQEYVEPMRRGLFEQRWVDWGQNQGKRAGAYSSGLKGTFPYIFMSWSDDLFSMSTLAHELGHSMHSYFTRNSQPAIYAGYSLFIAEVASNFNQAMVRSMLLREAKTPEYKLASGI